MDGAGWQQRFIDLHRPDAVRILDWRHGAEYLARAGQAAFGSGTKEASEWLGKQLHELKHGEPSRLLENLRGLCHEVAAYRDGGSEALKTLKTSLEYLEKRQAQIRYAQFQAEGYPIGSGAVESANKLVVEQRLKGAGMHWARENVNPMVALRTVVCSGRWRESWPEINRKLRQQARGHRRQRQARKKGRMEQNPREVPAPETRRQRPVHPRSRPVEAGPLTAKPHQPPSPNHPWRRMPLGRPVSSNPATTPRAKL